MTLKLHTDTSKRLYYENLLSNVLDIVLFGSRKALKLAKLLQGQQYWF